MFAIYERGTTVMNIDLLRTFVAVAKGKSFTAATKARHLTQSTVSHQIRRLEESLNQTLIKRTTRSCQLTDAGETLYQYAVKILELFDEAQARLSEKPLKGQIKFAAPEDFLSLPFSRILADFARKQSGVELEITVGLSEEIRPKIEEGQYDLAVLSQIPATGEGHPLCIEPLMWLASNNFSLAKGESIPLALVPAPCSYRKAAIAALEKAGIPWHIVVNCHSHEAIKAIVESGMAITVLTQKDKLDSMRVLTHRDGLPKLAKSELSLHTPPNMCNEAALELMQKIIKANGAY